MAAPDRRSVAAAVRALGDDRIAWVYLGDRLPHIRALERQLAGSGRRVTAGEAIAAATTTLRQSYFDYVGELGGAAPVTWWRRSCVAEKNPLVSNLFLHVCTVHALEQLTAGPGHWLLVVENPVLRKTVARHLGAATHEPMLTGLRGRARDCATGCAAHVRFTARALARTVQARYRYRLHQTPAIRDAVASATPVCAANVWVDRRAYDPATGAFQDTDFGDVRRYLEAHGQRTFTVPNVLATASHARVLGHLARSGEPCLLAEAFLTPVDILRAVWRSLRSFPRRRACPPLSGIDVTDLIAADLRRDWSWQREARHALIERAVERWRAAGLNIDRFIYTFENHVWEQVLCQAFRRWFPRARLIGHQPNGLSRVQLNYYLADGERAAVPLPDTIVCNGRYATDVLRRSGYDPAQVVCGGGLRQRYLDRWFTSAAPAAGVRPQRRAVLVTTSIGLERAAEVLWKSAEAFAGRDDVRVTIKCHPSMPFDRVRQELGDSWSWPGAEIVTDSLSTLLPDAAVVLYSGEGYPAVEAIAAGVPVVYVEPEYGLPFNALDGFPDLYLRARTPEEIRATVFHVLATPAADLYTVGEACRRAARELVGPVSQDTFALFAQ